MVQNSTRYSNKGKCCPEVDQIYIFRNVKAKSILIYFQKRESKIHIGPDNHIVKKECLDIPVPCEKIYTNEKLSKAVEKYCEEGAKRVCVASLPSEQAHSRKIEKRVLSMLKGKT